MFDNFDGVYRSLCVACMFSLFESMGCFFSYFCGFVFIFMCFIDGYSYLIFLELGF